MWIIDLIVDMVMNCWELIGKLIFVGIMFYWVFSPFLYTAMFNNAIFLLLLIPHIPFFKTMYDYL